MEQDWHARGDLAQTERLRDWLESQACVLGFWMDRLAAQGDAGMMGRLEAHRRDLQSLLEQLN